MDKRFVFLFLSLTLVVVVVNFSLTGGTDTVVCSTDDNGVVSKVRGDDFTVKITFKNIGKTEGNWAVNVVFEGDFWIWKGTSQNLTLGDGVSKTLAWSGIVPYNATIDSMARLVVYYGDSYKALDWWIRVVPGAELTIQSSSVE
jgi:hypothetical protein